VVQELIAKAIDVLIIDPFVSSHQVDENANTKIDAITKKWGMVAKRANCSIVLSHHTKKVAGQKVTAELARGAVALIYAARQALVLNRMDAEDAARFGLSDEAERHRYFTVQDDKHNRAPAENADWFRLASVDLGNGGVIGGDSVGVAEPWTPPDPFDGLTGDDLLQVQMAIAEGEHREDWQSPAWVGHVVARVLGFDSNAKPDRARIRKLVATWIAEGVLIVTERDDDKRKSRKWIEVGRWQNDPSAPPRSAPPIAKGVAVVVEQGITFSAPPPPPPL
jgi:hypothetical protein